MTIKSLDIKNFRCFESLRFDLGLLQGLIGENGTGKTAVLEALNLVTSSSYLPSRINEQDFHNSDSGDIEISIEFDKPFICRVADGYTYQDIPCAGVKLDVKRRRKAGGGKALSEPFVVEHYVMPISYTDKSRVDNTAYSSQESKLNIPSSVNKTVDGYKSPRKTGSEFKFTNRQLTLQNDMVGFPQVFYFDKSREKEARTGYNTLLNKIANDLNWRFRDKWDKDEIIKLWEAYYNKTVELVFDPKKEKFLSPVQNKLKEYTGNDYGNLEISLLSIEEPFAKSFLSERADTNQVEQRGLGSGISILISYFLLETISSLSKEEIIFLIDEPELHLHPQLQQKLFKDFNNSKYQIVYTTQSDIFVDISNWEAFARFTNEHTITPKTSVLVEQFGGKTIKDHLGDIKRFAQQKTIFTRQDNEILFARRCLLVEGPAEKYGLITLADRQGKTFNGVTIISCNGKTKIPCYQLICKAYGIPYYTVFDLDNKNDTEGDNKQPKDCSDTAALTTFHESFESLLGIKQGESHKGSNTLLKIDGLDLQNIPADISTCIEAIETWSKT